MVLLASGILGYLAWPQGGGADYTVERIEFFQSDRATENDPWEARNLNAWCEARATLESGDCSSIIPFEVTTPFIHVELRVAYANQRPAEVPVTCTLINDDDGRVVSSTQALGVLPDARYSRLGRTGWLATFERAESARTPGRYRATCETPSDVIEGWFRIVD